MNDVLSNTEKKQLRTIGHHLKPIITIAEKGVTETIATEIERALNDHELIKVKININGPAVRKEIISKLCDQHKTILVQGIGKVALLLRRAKQPNEKLSNLIRSVSKN